MSTPFVKEESLASNKLFLLDSSGRQQEISPLRLYLSLLEQTPDWTGVSNFR